MTFNIDKLKRRMKYKRVIKKIPVIRRLLPILRAALLFRLKALRREFFEQIFAAAEDPWQYDSSYEQEKYEQTLAIIPCVRIKKALEIGCAEGRFTRQLSPRVESLTAADISQIALGRAAKRCSGLENVGFRLLDIVSDQLPGEKDLIVCSETLYYVGSLEALRKIARKIAAALAPGGYLVMAHSNVKVDEPHKTGFDWDFSFGAKVIGETFSATRPKKLRLLKEVRTPLYRVHLFQHSPYGGVEAPEIIEFDRQSEPLPPRDTSVPRVLSCS
jgi:SAM-dependent methyltransferase